MRRVGNILLITNLPQNADDGRNWLLPQPLLHLERRLFMFSPASSSHIFLLFQMLDNNYERIIILEDDVRFGLYFKTKLFSTLAEADELDINWDLM